MSGYVRSNTQIVGSMPIVRTHTTLDEHFRAQFVVGALEDWTYLYATVSELIELSDTLAHLAVELLSEVTAAESAGSGPEVPEHV